MAQRCVHAFVAAAAGGTAARLVVGRRAMAAAELARLELAHGRRDTAAELEPKHRLLELAGVPRLELPAFSVELDALEPIEQVAPANGVVLGAHGRKPPAVLP